MPAKDSPAATVDEREEDLRLSFARLRAHAAGRHMDSTLSHDLHRILDEFVRLRVKVAESNG